MNPLRILLIEDENTIADIYIRMLSRLVSAFPGATISRVDNLADAREMIRGIPPDAAVLDLNLKDASAPETIEEIKEIKKRCPVVVVTGLETPSLRKECLDAGASGFLLKTDMNRNPTMLEKLVTGAISTFKIKKREGLSRDIEALRRFANEHGPET